MREKRQYSADFGTRTDWSTRVRDSYVKYDEGFAYVRDIVEELPPTWQEKRREVMNRLIETQEDLNRQQADLHKIATKAQLMAHINLFTSSKDTSKSSKTKTTVVPVSDLDLSFFKVGFLNGFGKGRKTCSAVAFSRVAVRQYKHGLNARNTTYQPIHNERNVLPRNFFSREFLLPMLFREYPTVNQCLDQLFAMEGRNSMAFDLEYAVEVDDIGHTLLYRNQTRVGYMEGDNTFILLPRFHYLRESLTEKGVNLAP